ncbi:hypothetical protein P1X15_32500 [Runella sp. MFBS21]|uniref:hypothetical protein n=1 Tax=Runella sp. MFBS21 TaxID=3034018 RepID=UPI0023F8571C|nr:hypothetical protein [Runella sp. MFBS21]MDF7822374.1 hypothetical protein [Runella sp. MFBS21]
MILQEDLNQCSPQQLREMLAEAKRAQKVFKDNPNVPLKVVASYQLDGDEIMSIESGLTHDFVVAELQIIAQLILDVLQSHE